MRRLTRAKPGRFGALARTSCPAPRGAELLVTSNSDFTVAVTITGGKIQQKLNGIDLSVGRTVEKTNADGTKSSQSETLWKTRKETPGQLIEPGSVLTFEVPAGALALQTLFDDPNDYAAIVMADDDELVWASDEPMPFAGAALPELTLALPELTLYVSADIPGAIDPGASQSLVVLPEAEVPLGPSRPMTDGELNTRLERAQQVWAVNNIGDRWFVWWTSKMRTVACAELKAIVSVRPEGVVRTYTNDRVPRTSVLDKQSDETSPQRPGGMDEAFDWARQLAQKTNLTLLPRPIGNAVFGLDRVQIRADW